MATRRFEPLLDRIAFAPLKNSMKTVTATNVQSMKETSAHPLRTPVAASTAASATPASIGQRNARFRLSTELRRQAISGPTPVRNIRNIAIGISTRLKKGASTLIFSPETASEITGNKVPHRTAKQLARRIRLLNRKLDSRERTLSSCDSLFRKSRRLRIR